MRNKKGITLVSLVVTIIVLIILAGVSINLTLGENGIITMAKKARENMELAKVDEERQLNELYMQMEQEGVSGGISYDAIAKLVEFKRQIASAITDMGIETAENADATTMSSNIRSLTGASSADKISYDNTNSNLAATNVQGAVDEINDSLEGEWVLLNSTTYKAEQRGTPRVITIPNLSKYKKICIEVSAGDAGGFQTPILEKIGDGTTDTRFASMNMGSTEYYSRTTIIVSFNKETVSITGISTGWDLGYCSFSKIWGIR